MKASPLSGDRHDGAAAPHTLDAGGQEPGGPPLHQDLGIAAVRAHQFALPAGAEGVIPVDDQQRPLKDLLPGEDDLSHAAAPNSMMRLTRVVKPQPAAAIMLG